MAEIELIYSQQDGDFLKGRAYSNPRFYSGPRQGVAKVFIVGHWPQIEEDYAARGVLVERLDPQAALAVRTETAAAEAKTLLVPEGLDRAAVLIPDDWRDLPYTGPADALTLRQLAGLLSDEPIKNKAEAVKAVEAQIALREAYKGEG